MTPPQSFHLSAIPPSTRSVRVTFADNLLLPTLFGQQGAHLRLLETKLGLEVQQRGNVVVLRGDADACARAKTTLQSLYARLEGGERVDADDVKAALHMERAPDQVTKIAKRNIRPRTTRQQEYWQGLQQKTLVFGLGPAGTGKTFLAVAAATQALLAGKIARIILSRPAVEAGERLGFLPGDMRDKIDPYLMPLYDALHELLPAAQVARRLEAGEIEIAPLAFMRGRTLSNAFIILDEAQNVTSVQMKMFLTRLGAHSHMVIAGDPSQVDLPHGQRSGLLHGLDILDGIDDMAVTRFDEKDVVRHDLVAKIVAAYDKASAPPCSDKEP